MQTSQSFFFFFKLHWVFVALQGLSLAAVSRGFSLGAASGFSLRGLLLLQSSGSTARGSVVQLLALEQRLSSWGPTALAAPQHVGSS